MLTEYCTLFLPAKALLNVATVWLVSKPYICQCIMSLLVCCCYIVSSCPVFFLCRHIYNVLEMTCSFPASRCSILSPWPNPSIHALMSCTNRFAVFPAAQFFHGQIPVCWCFLPTDLLFFQLPSFSMIKSQYVGEFSQLISSFTAAQFFRCLWQTLNLKLNAEDEKAIINRYDIRRDGTINYRMFCDDINLNFNPTDLKKDPVEQRVEPPELWVVLLSFCFVY